jgi:hypothetical protein
MCVMLVRFHEILAAIVVLPCHYKFRYAQLSLT